MKNLKLILLSSAIDSLVLTFIAGLFCGQMLADGSNYWAAFWLFMSLLNVRKWTERFELYKQAPEDKA